MNINKITDKILDFFKSIGSFWKKTESSKKIWILVVSVLVILVASAAVWALNRTSYSVLYTNLSSADAGEILTKLNELGVDAKPQGTDTILVSADKVDLTRMELAADGYPKDSTSLDILEQGTGFGVTEEDKAIYRRYQLQQDLQNAIKTFDSIADAKVSLYIPEESSFVIQDETSQSTAAVLVTLRPGKTLSAENVTAITELVRKSVSGLTTENVSVIDSEMNVLTGEESSLNQNQNDQQSMEQQVGERLKKQVMNLLQPVFGIGSILSEVSVTLNFDENSIDKVTFEPMEGSDKGIISAIETIREATKNASSGAAGGTAGTDSNGVSTYPVTDTSDTVYENNSEKISYEISTIQEHIEKAKGTISKLSVSVVIDSNNTKGVDYSENIKKLVSTAIGVSTDFITVDALPFSGSKAIDLSLEESNKIAQKAEQAEQTRFIALAAGGVLAGILFLFVLSKLFKRKKTKSDLEEFEEAFPSLKPPVAAIDIKIEENTETTREALIIEKDKSEKAVVEKYVESNPELVASIIRTWLAEDDG